MKFKRLKINNFLAIGEVEVELDSLGLMLIQGINDDEPSASSNGSGKSSIGDALSWALFGKTARGLSADAVVNKAIGKNTLVELEIEDSGNVYLVRRYRKHDAEHNRLTLHQVLPNDSEQDLTKGTDKLTQEDVEALLGCSYEVFCVAVYAGQERFPDLPGLTDKALKVLIEEAAGIERLQRAYEVARERLNQVKTQYELRDLEWSRLNDQLQIHQRRQTELKQQIADWLRQQQDQRDKWQQEAAQKRQEAERLQATIDARQVSQLNTALQSVQSRLSAASNPAQERQLEAATQQAAVYLGTAQQHEGLTRQQLDQARHELQHLDQRVGTACRECGKVYQAEDLDQARVAIHQKIRQLQNALEQSQQTVAECSATHSKALQDLQTYRESLPDLSKLLSMQQRILDHLSKIQGTQQAIERLVSDSEQLEQQALADQPNPLQTALEGLQRDLDGVSKELLQVEQHRSQLEQDLLLAKDAVDVFAPAGVRAQILDTVTPFLNDRTAGYLGLLSDGNILATWQTLTRNKKGELKEKFCIDVTSATGGADFRSLSGGEKRKVRLATALALADLVASRATKPIHMLVCDEVDDAMDASGLERLMAVLEQKAQDRGTLLVISHNDLAGYIRQTLTVRKTNGLARLE